MSGPADPLGLYVHVPFCERKCAYCHFAIDPRRPGAERQERYTAALLAEIGGREGGLPADTLYFGGGTPSLLAVERLARVIDALRARFPLEAGAEITLEANPGDLDEAACRELLTLGVNRLSLGVQSLDDAVLREMGRAHDGAAARAAVDAARRAGFANLSLDIILGWPGEGRERFERTLAGALRLAPDHVSLYLLEVEGRTLLAHEQRLGRLRLPPDDLVADLYERSVAALGEAGIERYEISNFARPGFESRHNGKYWDDAPFLGYGMSAHSYHGGRRTFNRDSFGAYCTAVEEGGAAAARAGERTLGARERAGEALFTGLRRREGVELTAFSARHGLDPLAAFADGLRDPLRAGLVEVSGGRLRLTSRGVLLSNEVFGAFV